MNEPTPDGEPMQRLLDIMARLREPDGCAWDREQTPASLKQQLLEECYEVVDAIDSGSRDDLREELGDLLLHVVFQAQIAAENGDFTFEDVATGIADKLVRRHPHVFGDVKVTDSAGVRAQWQALKKAEKPERTSALDGVPRALPALMRADALQRRAGKIGFDWPNAAGALDKVREEAEEVAAAMRAGEGSGAAGETSAKASDHLEEEIGDLLFSVVNLSRHLHLNAEDLLHRATEKFQRRFRDMERQVAEQGIKLEGSSPSQLDRLWEASKAAER